MPTLKLLIASNHSLTNLQSNLVRSRKQGGPVAVLGLGERGPTKMRPGAPGKIYSIGMRQFCVDEISYAHFS